MWHEALHIPESTHDINVPPADAPPPPFASCTPWAINLSLQWPDLNRYMEMVRNYNDRHLTYPEDALAAFAGVTSTLSDVFPGGFVCGLPEMYFDVALLWQPASPLERRRTSSQNIFNTSLPSWSWAGWRGDIDVSSWASGYAQKSPNNRYPQISKNSPADMFECETRPICQWSCSEGSGWRKLNIRLHEYLAERRKYIKNPKKLAQGWSIGSLSESDKPHFVHVSEPEAKFFFPVPFGAVRGQRSDHLGHLLSCRTRRACFLLGRQISQRWIPCSIRKLKTDNGVFCGFLRLNATPNYILNESHDPLEGTVCELIAISKGSPSTIENMDSLGDEVYNVLWIEWENGIAYRKALGQVTKGIWERKAKKRINVTLG